MKDRLTKGKKTVNTVAEKAFDGLVNKYKIVRNIINDLPVFISTEIAEKYSNQQYDEKHYFVIPFMLSDVGIALHSMRCLPLGIPEINDLPKRRIFHFPNKHSEALVRELLLDNARTIAETKHLQNPHTLISLANDLDSLEKKLSYGMFVLGSITATVNPLLGVGIAAKAIFPGMAGLFTKYGIRPMGEKMSQSQLEKKIKEVELKIREDFEASSTIQVVNPILQELELALRTTESEHDPIIDFDLSEGSINELDNERWRDLTETALFHIYKDVINNPKMYNKACLGPEDIRWLKVIFSGRSINET